MPAENIVFCLPLSLFTNYYLSFTVVSLMHSVVFNFPGRKIFPVWKRLTHIFISTLPSILFLFSSSFSFSGFFFFLFFCSLSVFRSCFTGGTMYILVSLPIAIALPLFYGCPSVFFLSRGGINVIFIPVKFI